MAKASCQLARKEKPDTGNAAAEERRDHSDLETEDRGRGCQRQVAESRAAAPTMLTKQLRIVSSIFDLVVS
jgi:hypothetical protein